jgi:hypothetical protein
MLELISQKKAMMPTATTVYFIALATTADSA